MLRPALVDLGTPQEGYAISIYLKAVGNDQNTAIETWGAALADVVRVIRSREFARSLA